MKLYVVVGKGTNKRASGAVRIVWPGQFRNFPYSCQVGSP